MSDRVDLALRSLGGAALVAAGAYALAVPRIAVHPIASHDTTVSAADAPESRPALDRTAFGVSLWVEPKAPPPAPKPVGRAAAPPPPPPPALDLIAISREAGGWNATVYDRGADRLMTVAAGDPLAASCTVTAVEPTRLRLAHAGREIVYELDQPRLRETRGGHP